MPKHWYMQFDCSRWKGDQALRRCAPVSRGIWIDWLCAMHDADRSGRISDTVGALASLAGCMPKEAAFALCELRRTNAAEVEVIGGGTDITVNASVTLTNRRMRREYLDRKLANIRQLRHRGEPTDEAVTALSRECSPSEYDSLCQRLKDNEGKLPRARAKNPLWDAVADSWFGGAVAEPQETRVGKVVRDLNALGATPDELRKRVKRYRETWPTAECTPEAIVKHWARFDGRGGVARRTPVDPGGVVPQPAPVEPAQVQIVPAERRRNMRSEIQAVKGANAA